LNNRRSEGHAILAGLDAARCETLLLSLLDRLDDGVEIRPVAGIEFGMEQFAIGANLESAAARGNQREQLYALAELKNFGRQTDGLRRVVSNDAVFDRDLGLHRLAPFQGKLSARPETVKPRRHLEQVRVWHADVRHCKCPSVMLSGGKHLWPLSWRVIEEITRNSSLRSE